jgi:hypothetical protein|mmetsp:Transcript_10789/g.19700  ORF Transcript_10789/g.19700 Transcript_10789/m.19700 type:complete len:85 (-) Transcript_10789:64-318(-)
MKMILSLSADKNERHNYVGPQMMTIPEISRLQSNESNRIAFIDYLSSFESFCSVKPKYFFQVFGIGATNGLVFRSVPPSFTVGR